MVKKVKPLQYEMQEAILGDALVFFIQICFRFFARCNKNKKKETLLFIAFNYPPPYSYIFRLYNLPTIYPQSGSSCLWIKMVGFATCIVVRHIGHATYFWIMRTPFINSITDLVFAPTWRFQQLPQNLCLHRVITFLIGIVIFVIEPHLKTLLRQRETTIHSKQIGQSSSSGLARILERSSS